MSVIIQTLVVKKIGRATTVNTQSLKVVDRCVTRHSGDVRRIDAELLFERLAERRRLATGSHPFHGSSTGLDAFSFACCLLGLNQMLGFAYSPFF